MNIAYLLKLIQLAGTKLPQAWPIIMHIAADVQQLVALFSDARPVFMATADTAKALDAMNAAGIDADEAQSVVQIFSAAESAGL